MRVMLVDDEANILSALRRALLPVLPPDTIIEPFTDPSAALDRLREAEFDIAVADYRMPQMNGVELLCEVRKASPHTVRLMLSGVSDFAVILDAVNTAQIFHYVCKPWEQEELRTVFEKALAQRAESLRTRGDAAAAQEAQSRLSGLSAREREVMELMVAGKPSKLIARELGISARTVENHRAKVMDKSGAGSLSELVKMAMRERRS